MGELFLVYDRELAATFALKRILPELSRCKDWSRFRREILHLQVIRHPNIVRIIDASIDDGEPYYTMEYCSGGSLETLLPKTRENAQEVENILAQVLLAIRYLHTRSDPIVHRDLKPQNILLGDDGKVKVADFGLSVAASDTSVTSSNWGSHGFAAPEQLHCMHDVDHRADIYSAGAVAFYLYVGEPPHFSNISQCNKMGERLRVMIPRMLQHEPANRPATVNEILLALDIDICFRSNSAGQYTFESAIGRCDKCNSFTALSITVEPAGTVTAARCLTCGDTAEEARGGR